MSDMPMPGGWSMSMMWMRMPGQSWPGAAASFLGMWIMMMVPMMLPSLASALWRYREAVRTTTTFPREGRIVRLSALVSVAYFFVWTVFGVVAFPLGLALASVAMQAPAFSRAVPMMAGVIVLIAGAIQFTAWKARHLACCREIPDRGCTLPADAHTALRFGLRLGLHCNYCCANLMVILMVLGMMDVRAMISVAAAITLERLGPAGERVARAIGSVIVGAAVFLIARAAGI